MVWHGHRLNRFLDAHEKVTNDSYRRIEKNMWPVYGVLTASLIWAGVSLKKFVDLKSEVDNNPRIEYLNGLAGEKGPEFMQDYFSSEEGAKDNELVKGVIGDFNNAGKGLAGSFVLSVISGGYLYAVKRGIEFRQEMLRKSLENVVGG